MVSAGQIKKKTVNKNKRTTGEPPLSFFFSHSTFYGIIPQEYHMDPRHADLLPRLFNYACAYGLQHLSVTGYSNWKMDGRSPSDLIQFNGATLLI